jgi:hypothetical protein
MGKEPSRSSTKNSHEQALKLFNEFLGTKLMGPLPLSSTDRERSKSTQKQVCQVNLLGELATFIRDAKKEGEYRFKPGSAKNRLGEIKGQIERVFGAMCFNRHDPDGTRGRGTRFDEIGPDAWFKVLKRKLEKDVFHRCWETGRKSHFNVKSSHLYFMQVTWQLKRVFLVTEKRTQV